MTNAEVFIGDEETIDTFIEEFCDFAYERDVEFKYLYLKETLEAFFKKERKPKPELTEDERVILRNLHEEYKHIKRNEMGNLYIGVDYFGMYDNLFQFIKERRRILNRGVVRRCMRCMKY